MAAKTQANWSQGSTDKPTEIRIVHTRANTPLEDWKQLVRTELENSDVVFGSLNPLTLLHAWEMGDTPYAFAYTQKDQLKRRLNRAMIKSSNP